MKATIISMLLVLCLLVALPLYVFNDSDLMSDLFSGGGKDSIASLKAKAPKNITTVVTDKEVKMYKWVDQYGVVQFSQTPPPDGGAAQAMTLSPELNTMQKPYMEPKPEAAPQAGNFEPGNPYSPKKMKQMLDQTNQLKDQLNQQMADRDKAMQEMLGR